MANKNILQMEGMPVNPDDIKLQESTMQQMMVNNWVAYINSQKGTPLCMLHVGADGLQGGYQSLPGYPNRYLVLSLIGAAAAALQNDPQYSGELVEVKSILDHASKKIIKDIQRRPDKKIIVPGEA